MGIHECTYLDHDYNQAMNTKHAQLIHSAGNQTLYMHMRLPAPGCTYDCTLSFWAHLWSSCL